MLPLVSSMTMTVIGCVSFWKNTSGCGFSLSNTSKSLCCKSGTRRFWESITVANTETIWVPDRKVGCWASGNADQAATADVTSNAGIQKPRERAVISSA